MNNLDEEYDLFKKICNNHVIENNPENKLICEKIINKGLKLKLTDSGYCLTNDVIKLSKDQIESKLSAETIALIQELEVIYETDSTNKCITDKKVDFGYTILVAESQTHGSGRRQNKWASPLGENIYLSVQFNVKNNNNIHFLPLITAVSICKTLQKSGIVDCQIKWPNDIYLKNKKLGGILVESRYNSESGHTIVVGIGLNINMHTNQEIDQSWTSLFNESNNIYDRNTILSDILSALINQFEHVSELDTQQFLLDWKALDYLNGLKIHIVEDDQTYSGRALGLSGDGALLVECMLDDQMVKKKIYSADVSVKKNDKQIK